MPQAPAPTQPAVALAAAQGTGAIQVVLLVFHQLVQELSMGMPMYQPMVMPLIVQKPQPMEVDENLYPIRVPTTPQGLGEVARRGQPSLRGDQQYQTSPHCRETSWASSPPVACSSRAGGSWRFRSSSCLAPRIWLLSPRRQQASPPVQEAKGKGRARGSSPPRKEEKVCALHKHLGPQAYNL